MNNNLVKKIEVFTNIAIILVALILGIVLVKKFLFTDSPKNSPKETVAVGKKINFDQIDWASNNHTLLLILSKDCHFCSESMPFYQKLTQEISHNPAVRISAVFPQDTQTAKSYLDSNQLRIDQLYQADPPAFGVGGTPTMLLINNQGQVEETWFGKLTEDEQQKVLKRLNLLSNNS